ncbi:MULTISPECIES: thiamine pyrophosphate-binding protein [Halomonas]|uniref:thiamine pyrophosphate-binding protein n=1 Tax=Halomonas TaxID=2745 RepID=UPI001C974CA0|nr:MULTISPECIES: thiamine pyrophosphate-binding protein [Halomonas]MED5297086.1 thiamine pyrophosphate-binding protein [Pseudomonadota bacterium]MBY5967797.1 thiamine pyrophosphate-binding protein [Halomonas denitrificans]MBY6206092.1 thiamine pyrophosphate-binding protein [Halomonas sp. DP3Y7-2]MBY6228017.1 thiamine pyrophosphate-binding protein [Halomonas sp. DP3Y7-1]MCA0916084.1 thiamine pyrophosphate-binding protein [Halomonas denitrificans]
MTHPHGGLALVKALQQQRVERVFCVPGESYLAALDALHEAEIETIVARQEGGAAMMAEADGKLSGRPGVAFVTRGPGATNAASGVHVAYQDSTPMVLFVGQVASDQRDREAFQEVDLVAMFSPLAKWVANIDRVDRLPEYISHAFHVAQSGRPGPVVLGLPEDMLSSDCDAAPVPAATLPSGLAAQHDVQAVMRAIGSAERPLVIVGGGGWSARAAEALGHFARLCELPVGASFRCQDYLDNRHPNYVGDVGIGINPALAQRVRDADLILALGARLGEMTTSGYTLLTPPLPRQRLIHVHADPSELGRVYRPELAVVACAGAMIEQLAAAAEAPSVERGAWVRAARDDYASWQQPEPTPGALRMENVIARLNEVLGDDAILTNGAGNYSAWLHRYYRYRGFRTQLAPTSGSMGYGLPAAIAAKLRHPERDAICLAGDGCFQMVSQELGTACQYGAAVVILVINNGMYGTIRMHQQKRYPRRPSATDLVNPDFAALARAYGAFGETVDHDDAFADALSRALEHTRRSASPALLELRQDRQALSPRLTLEQLNP